ncbi:MAG: hypothetical protein N4A45_01820 [Flavobacteriales bacterium]|jgi:hypothetical protein|nr:hypothetical protein [Flavobacteriales bacterium]
MKGAKKIWISALLLPSLIAMGQNKEAYSQSVNLQQESIEPYSVKNRKGDDPYHYRERAEHEIKYGRPILDKNFDNAREFHKFFQELSDEFLGNYQRLIEADLEEKRRDKMLAIRRATLADLEYATYRAKTISTKDEKLDFLRQNYFDVFQHLFEDYKHKMPKYLDSYYSKRHYDYKKNENKDKTGLNHRIYIREFNQFFGHIHPLVSDLYELKNKSEALLRKEKKPDLEQEYILKEYFKMAEYRNNLYILSRTTWQESEAFFNKLREVLHTKYREDWTYGQWKTWLEETKQTEKLQILMNNTVAVSIDNMKELKKIPKYQSDVSLKNNVNKYLKFAQTSGKSTFKKIISTIDKAKTIGKPQTETINLAIDTYKERESEYFMRIKESFMELKNKYTDQAVTDAQEKEQEILKEREQKAKAKEREDERKRKSYWKNRNR